MPINLIHSKLRRVATGWDPISAEYSQRYNEFVTRCIESSVVNELASRVRGLQGKSVLDLGGGPGHFSVKFAEMGAQVTWHDISREYQRIAKARADAHGVSLQYSLGYLEDATRLGRGVFDIVFCRVCWYYCRGDRAFASIIYSLLKPGGTGYIECNTPAFTDLSIWRRLQSRLN